MDGKEHKTTDLNDFLKYLEQQHDFVFSFQDLASMIFGDLSDAVCQGEDQEFRNHLFGRREGSARFQYDVRVTGRTEGARWNMWHQFSPLHGSLLQATLVICVPCHP